jgi:hypothetical protein
VYSRSFDSKGATHESWLLLALILRLSIALIRSIFLLLCSIILKSLETLFPSPPTSSYLNSCCFRLGWNDSFPASRPPQLKTNALIRPFKIKPAEGHSAFHQRSATTYHLLWTISADCTDSSPRPDMASPGSTRTHKSPVSSDLSTSSDLRLGDGSDSELSEFSTDCEIAHDELALPIPTKALTTTGKRKHTVDSESNSRDLDEQPSPKKPRPSTTGNKLLKFESLPKEVSDNTRAPPSQPRLNVDRFSRRLPRTSKLMQISVTLSRLAVSPPPSLLQRIRQFGKNDSSLYTTTPWPGIPSCSAGHTGSVDMCSETLLTSVTAEI